MTVSSATEAVSPEPDAPPCRLDIDAALDDAAPDIVLMHWSTHAEAHLELMERHDLPFAVRLHSFDLDVDVVARVRRHPLCAAVFAPPHHVSRYPSGVIPLIPVVGPRTVIPPSPPVRTLVLSASAGLPKKDFPLLVEAMARLPEHERMIILARANGMLELPDQVIAMAAAADPEIAVRVNVPRRDCLPEVARTSVALYTLDDRHDVGYPMSIVEAMLCGAIVVAPDRPEFHDIVGEQLRPYRTVDDIVSHVRAVAAGGPAVDAAREALRRRAARHRAPAEVRRLHDALRDAVTAALGSGR